MLNVERENLVSEVSPRAVISRIFHGLEDPIGILDAATDTMSQTYTHTHAHITYPIPLTNRTLCWETLFTPNPHLLLHDAPLGKADNLILIQVTMRKKGTSKSLSWVIYVLMESHALGQRKGQKCCTGHTPHFPPVPRHREVETLRSFSLGSTSIRITRGRNRGSWPP